MSKKSYTEMRADCAHFWPPEFPVSIKYNPRELVDFRCDKPIADDSLDHIEPRGTARDNTHWVPFVAKCEEIFGFRDLRYLDLGCAGGGLVFDFAIRRHFAIGLEGSDYSLKCKRAEWATVPDNLFTCDITRPFLITDKRTQSPMLFDVIGIWDALEHLPEAHLDTFFENVRTHLAPDGLFCGTVSTRSASKSESGGNHHQTVQPRSWWDRQFLRSGFEPLSKSPFAFEEYPRGNGVIFPADFRAQPDDGFHFIVRRSTT
jgi:SAM-dependent methyltransferase